MLDLTDTIITSVVTGAVALWGYFFRRHSARLDKIETDLIKAKISIDRHPNKQEVQEIISDKIEPIYIYIKEIKEDLKEIKQDVKRIR